MDPHIVAWVAEFLIRHKTPSPILNAFLADPYFSVREIDNPRLKKTICLRTIQDEIARGAVLSESILESLEIIEEIVRKGGNLISRSMKLAYCAVALECTVTYFRDGDEGKFFEAVVRIWRGRVEELELKKSQLVTDEMREFKEEIESALWNPKAREKLLLKVGKIEAGKLVKDYVEEALAAMGPSFIDLAAELECRLKRKRDAAMPDGNGVVTEEGNNAGSGPNLIVLDRTASPDLKRRRKDGEAKVVEQNQSNTDTEQVVINGPARQGKEDGDKAVTEKENIVDTGPDLFGPGRPANSGAGVHGRPRDTMDSQRVETGIASRKFNLIPTPVVVKVREALNHSLMELKALVKDPLPEALRATDPSVQNPTTNDAGPSSPPIDAEVSKATAEISNTVPSQVIENTSTNAETAMPIRQVDAPKSSLMERNSTACTFEWNDSIDNLPRDKLVVESRRKVPTSNKVENRVGLRRKKKWSLEEEEGLREGVKRFGAGNWALILKSNHSLFSERRSVDLKDKWRNMMKHSQG